MPHRLKRRELRVLLACLAAALVLAQVAAAPRDPRQRPGGRKTPPLLIIGQKAPDVELPRLVLTRTKDGNLFGKLSEEKVKLSAAWPKRPVCIFASSYT